MLYFVGLLLFWHNKTNLRITKPKAEKNEGETEREREKEQDRGKGVKRFIH